MTTLARHLLLIPGIVIGAVEIVAAQQATVQQPVVSVFSVDTVVSVLKGSILFAAVVGVPDLKWGEIPLAVVVPKENAAFADKEIVRLVKGSVDSGVLPREAITLKVRRTERIDKTSVGKTDKVALRKRFI